MSEPSSDALRLRGYELRRNVLFQGLFCAAGLGASVDVVFLDGMNQARGGFSLFAMLFGLVFGTIVVVRDSFPRRRPVDVFIDAEGLRVGSAPPVRPEDIALAKLVPKRGFGVDTVLELGVERGGKRRLRLWLSHADATRAMEALGALPGERRTPFSTMIPFWKRLSVPLGLAALWTLPMVALAAMRAGGLGFAEALLTVFVCAPGFLFVATLFARALGYVRPQVLVGAEGFAVRLLGRERFVHFREVGLVTRADRILDRTEFDTKVKLRSGKVMRLRPVVAPDTPADVGSSAEALCFHLAEAFRRYGEASAGAELRVALAREGRSGRDWLSALDALVRGGAARYRVAAVDPEQLTGVARDPNAPEEARVAAAAALLRTGDPRSRVQVRVAAEACAIPELRGTLLALVDAGDDDAMAAALDARPR
jgi:hypothetical protein